MSNIPGTNSTTADVQKSAQQLGNDASNKAQQLGNDASNKADQASNKMQSGGKDAGQTADELAQQGKETAHVSWGPLWLKGQCKRIGEMAAAALVCSDCVVDCANETRERRRCDVRA